MDELNELLKQQAHDLVLTPSSSVWVNVEADIERRERKRRWLFLWLFILAFLLGGIAVYKLWAKDGLAEPNKDLKPASAVKANGLKQEHIIESPVAIGFTDPNEKRDQAATLQKGNSITEEIAGNTVAEASAAPQENMGEIAALQVVPAKHKVVNGTVPVIIAAHPDIAAVLPVAKEEAPEVASIMPGDVRMMKSDAAGRPSFIEKKHQPQEMQPVKKDEQLKKVKHIPAAKKATYLPVNANTPALIQPPIEAAAQPIVTSATDNPVQVEEPPARSDNKLQKAEQTADTPQYSPVTKTKKNRWSFAASFTPAINYNHTREVEDTFFIWQYRDSSSKKRATLSYNITASYKVLPSLEIYSGIGIRSIGERIQSAQLIYARDTNVIISGPNSVGRIVLKKTLLEGNDSSAMVTNKFTYLEVPLGLRFRVLKQKQFALYAYADVTVNYLVRSKGYYFDFKKNDYQSISNDRLKNWLLAYGAGVSLQYNLRDNLGVELAPYYRRYPSSVYKADDRNKLSQYFQQAGLQFSIRYTPGKVSGK